MGVEPLIEKWQGSIAQVTIGAAQKDGGSRSKVVTVGGQSGLPALHKESSLPNAPAIAYEIYDVPPQDWPEALQAQYKSVWQDPLAWADHCVRKLGAGLLCVKLQGAHPDSGDRSPEAEQKFISDLLKAVPVPLIVMGCGDEHKDNLVLPACSEAAKGQKCLFGSAVQENYKTLVGAVLADGHGIVAESPIDINIAKQLNILICDMGVTIDRIVMDPTIGALGYGLEYAYSIMERARLAAFAGDKMLAAPFICFVGQEISKAKEALVPMAEYPSLGSEKERYVAWEAVTSTALLQAGADILVMRHPGAIAHVNNYIREVMMT